jgi:hypothetical protein
MPSDAAFRATDGPLIKPTPTATPSNDTVKPLTGSDDDTVNANKDELVAVTDNSGTVNSGVSVVFTATDVFGAAVSRLQLSRCGGPSLPAASIAVTRASYTPSVLVATVVVVLDEHRRVPTPPFTLTDTQYTQRLANGSDRHNAVTTAALPLLTLGVRSVVDTLGETVSTTHRTVRGDRSADGAFTAHTFRLCTPSERSASASDEDDSDTTVQ